MRNDVNCVFFGDCMLGIFVGVCYGCVVVFIFVVFGVVLIGL